MFIENVTPEVFQNTMNHCNKVITKSDKAKQWNRQSQHAVSNIEINYYLFRVYTV